MFARISMCHLMVESAPLIGYYDCCMSTIHFYTYPTSIFLVSVVSIGHLTFFFLNDTAPTEIYPLSLHDALPIWFLSPREAHEFQAPPLVPEPHRHRDRHFLRHPRQRPPGRRCVPPARRRAAGRRRAAARTQGDRKSTRLNSSHSQISYAVFCLKKKNQPHEEAPDTLRFTASTRTLRDRLT